MNTNATDTPRNGWERFWFTPADPTLLGLIRICTGLIALYTFLVYGLALQDLMGRDAWYDLDLRLEVVRERPVQAMPLTGNGPVRTPEPPRNAEEQEYYNAYQRELKVPPLPPYPRTPAEAEYTVTFHKKYGADLRYHGLRPPTTDAEKQYLEAYTERWRQPPPAYAASEEEAKAVNDYMEREGGIDPRNLYSKGMPVWSAWFHVTDPTWMMVVHSGVVLAAFLFLIGLGTRVTAALTWMASLWYIHRNPAALFGADTMMNVLLLYLMIGPSGAALSVDRLLARWWARNKPRVVSRWYALFGKQVSPEAVAPAAVADQPQPSVSANVAIRLLQIHVSIIYLISGLSKLQGAAWWNHTAIWGVLANYEFAPLHFGPYAELLRFLGRNQLLFEMLMTSAGLFTLVFEIGYVFLIWRPQTRWVFLTGAVLLHGMIGMFMGLKTFSLLMLVMNMGFLYPQEVRWLLSWVFGPDTEKRPLVATPKPELAMAGAGSTGVHVKKK